MVHSPAPVWMFLMFPMGILFLIAGALIVYGLSQPRFRGASLTVLALGMMVFLAGGLFVTSYRVQEVQTATTRVESVSGSAVEVQPEDSPAQQVSVLESLPELASGIPSAPADLSSRIELFEGDRRTATRLDKLPEWVTAPEKADEWSATLDSGSLASFEECEAELLRAARERLGSHLATLHPETAGWQPDRDAIRNSRAVLRRVRETQLVRIDVANAVIREPLCREYWQLSLQEDVTDHLLAIYRPAISRERATWLAGGVGIATLLFGAAAMGLRMTGARPRQMTA